jgi:F-type H+-transporting ATPase subunit delta
MSDPSTSTKKAFDIGRGRIGATYAKAFLAVAEKSGRPEELLKELQGLVEQVIERFPDFDRTLSSPRVSVEEIMIDRVFAGRVSDELLKFLHVVSQHGRIDCLREIAESAVEQFQVARGMVTVSVITAAPINNDLQQRIRQALSDKLHRQVELKVSVDADILGGLIVRVGDTVFDGSIANQLQQLRTDAVERTYEQLRQSAEQLAGELSL